jgi:hypothetical protein
MENRLRWIGHINRMDNKRMVYQVFAVNLKEVAQEVDQNPDGGTVYMVI